MVKTARKEEVLKDEPKGDDAGEESGASETMKNLLEEANRLLMKSMALKEKDGDDLRSERITAMQSQLDALRKMKALRLSRITKEQTSYGLLDSGATHPMRGRKPGEDVAKHEKVSVTLANGQQVEMRMTDRGIMVVDQDQAEPIIPMCCMVEKLGYTVTWTQGGMKLSHPSRDEIQVEMRHGCPQMSKRTAMRIIDDLEKGRHVKTLQKVLNEEEEILRGLTEAHPVLRRLPREVRDQLVVAPSETLRGLPGCNRSRRKLLSEQGFVAHLYAGESDGYTLTRALQEVGGDRRRLVEIDILRQEPGRESHDMTLDHGPYPALLRAAIDGSLKGLVMGPNCRTRSVLRGPLMSLVMVVVR